MGWLGKLFGGGPTLESLQKLVEQKRFAEARLQAEQLAEQQLSATDQAEVARLREFACDSLARLNLDEAVGLRNGGEPERAREHFQLALELVCSAELRNEIVQAADEALVPEVAPPAAAHAASCGGCGSQPLGALPDDAELPDADSQLELILTSYPAELAERYRQKGELFQQAFLLSHRGEDDAALPLWQQVVEAERDELYWFESGAALARAGQLTEARTALENALAQNAGLLLATEALVPILISLGEEGTARRHLQQLLEAGQDPAFCHAQLALICLQHEEPEQATAHVRQALAAGVTESSFLLMAAALFEDAGELEDAEAVLRRLPGGGCGGGLSLPLAEFLLRQERDLAKVLDTFNAACRQEPDNPRWQLRVAQTYLARQWRKDGLKLLHAVIGDPRLDAELREEAKLLLASQEG